MLLALLHVFQSAPSLSMAVPQLWHIPSFILGVKHARLGHPLENECRFFDGNADVAMAGVI